MDIQRNRSALLEHESDFLDPFGTPVYVFREHDIRSNYRRVRSALNEHYPDSVVHFAVKANYNPAILAVLEDEGCSGEIYAGGELTAALTAGFEPSNLLVTGMNRKPEDVARALSYGVEYFLVDNDTELERLDRIAEEGEHQPKVLIRGNPAIEVPTHPEVATATRETKFGLDIESGRAISVAKRAASMENVELSGVQLHIGSQIRGVEPYVAAARAMCEFATDIRDELGVEIDILDLGGGFPVAYDGPVPSVEDIVERMADTITEEVDAAGLPRPTLFVEPGRRLVASAGTLLSSVGVVKETPYATFAVLDAGTNTIHSNWPYPIYALSEAEPTESYHVAGPLCYSGDVLREDVSLPLLKTGSVIAIDGIGAYSLGSASHTNAQPKPPILLHRTDGDIDVIRPPETYRSIVEDAEIPADLS